MDLPINTTGIRDGEMIIGFPKAKASAGTIMKIKGFYPPSKRWINELTDEQIRDKIGMISYFSKMNISERKQALLLNSTDNDNLYMEDVPNLQIKFIAIDSIGDTSIPGKLGKEQTSILLQGNPNDIEGYWPISYVFSLFPRVPGSKANKAALIFRPSLWTLLIKENINKFTGLVVNIANGNIENNTIENTQMCVIKKEFRPDLVSDLCIVDLNGNKFLNREDVINLAAELVPEVKDFPISLIDWFSQSIHKSLIQKLIRTRCKMVEFGGKQYPANAVLLLSFAILITSGYVLVPNLNRQVRGLESATKRLAVSIVEDSYINDSPAITSLFAAALFAQSDSVYLPSYETIRWWMTVAIEAQQNPYMYKYDWHNFNDKQQFHEWSHHLMSYCLMGEIKGFESDIKMMGSIALNKGIIRQIPLYQGWDVMNLTHCLDQHSLTDIAHYFLNLPTSYPELFNKIWTKVTGLNARKGQTLGNDKETFRNTQRTKIIMDGSCI